MIRGAAKSVKRRLLALHDDLAKQHNAVLITFWAVPGETPEASNQIGLVDETARTVGKDKGFYKVMGQELADSGAQDLWLQYADTIFPGGHVVLPQVKGRSKALYPMPTNQYGEPVLEEDPRTLEVPDEYTSRDFMQLLFRTFMTICYRLASPSTGKNIKVPWSAIKRDIRAYISPDHLPDELAVIWGESSTVTEANCERLLCHFWDRQHMVEDDEPVFEFYAVPANDGPMPRKAREIQPQALPNPNGEVSVPPTPSTQGQKGGRRRGDMQRASRALDSNESGSDNAPRSEREMAESDTDTSDVSNEPSDGTSVPPTPSPAQEAIPSWRRAAIASRVLDSEESDTDGHEATDVTVLQAGVFSDEEDWTGISSEDEREPALTTPATPRPSITHGHDGEFLSML